jgi:hypothetical protein
MLLFGLVTMEQHHRHEKRHGRKLNLNQLSCTIHRVTPEHRKMEKPLLLYEMELRYCIKCNSKHWFLGERIENPDPEFNPNDYWTWELEEMGFFNKGHESTAP